MKAILKVPEQDIEFELDTCAINQFNIIGRRPCERNPMMWERFIVGKSPITLITSNMPDGLRTTIVKIIEEYCNQ